MNVDEAVAQAMALLDERIEIALDDTEDLLRDLGATDEELETALRDHHHAMLECRRAAAVQIRRALARVGVH